MVDFAERLKRMTAADTEPRLSAADITDLLAQFAIVDTAGLIPSDPLWVPTYRMRAAAAEGWRWKAARASELISTDLDGDRMSADQIFEHCQRMAASYAAAGSTSTADR